MGLLTGDEYVESLRDGREIWIDGSRVDDVTTHPGFRNGVRSISRLYDSLHDADQAETLLTTDHLGNRTHRFFAPAWSAADLEGARGALHEWSKLSFGWMGRTPDYKAAFMASLGAAPEFYEPFGANAARWYHDYASCGLFLNHVLVDPPVDRNKPLEASRDVFLRVEKETDGGVILSGAKMLATGSAFTHATFIARNSASAARLRDGETEDFAIVCFLPMDTPGQKLLCRASYEARAHSPFDAPLASRFDENDAVLVLDKAFVPWENVLVYRDLDKARGFYAASGFMPRYVLQASVRLATKLDFMCGLFARAIAINGTDDFRGVQTAMGELVAHRNLFWALTAAMALDPQPSLGGSVVPKLEHAIAARIFAAQTWARVKELFDIYLGGAPLVVPGSVEDLRSEELAPTIERFYRGTDASAAERVKLYKLLWDATGSEFAGRHALYERNYSGNSEQMRLDALGFAQRLGRTDEWRDLIETCMADYDLEGFVAEPWSLA